MISWMVINWRIPAPTAPLLFIILGFSLGLFAPWLMNPIMEFINGFFDVIFSTIRSVLPNNWFIWQESVTTDHGNGRLTNSVPIYTEFGYYYGRVHDFFVSVPTKGNGLVVSSTVFVFVAEMISFIWLMKRAIVDQGRSVNLNQDVSAFTDAPDGSWIMGKPSGRSKRR